MIDETSDTLSYNVFGLIEITGDRLKIVANCSQRGLIQSNRIERVLDEPLPNWERPFSVSFGAWAIKKDDIYVVYQENLNEYDFETFKTNFTLIDRLSRAAVNEVALLLSQKS